MVILRFRWLAVLAIWALSQFGCKMLAETTTPATLAARTPHAALPAATAPALLPSATAARPAPEAPPALAPTPTPDYFSQDYPLSQNAYLIPLTVRHVTAQSAALFFELSRPADGQLVYRRAGDVRVLPISAESSPAEARHMINLQGLSPGVDYQAVLLLDGGDAGLEQPSFAGAAWDAVSFRTASDEAPLRFGVLGDASFGDEATHQLVDLMASQDLDFVIHTGDVVYETDSSDLVHSYLLKFFEPFSPLLHQLPVYTVPGNHDYDAAVRWQGAPFYDYAFPPFADPDFSYPESRRGNQYYAFAYKGVQFLMLDSQVLYGAEGRQEQDAWLTERLADPRFRFTIPIFHVAPYSSSGVHPDDALAVRYTWGPVFEEANVPLSFSGHFHHYERLIAGGVTYIVTGGGSSTLYAQDGQLPESQIYVRRTHFVLVEIFADYIQLTAIAKEGDVIDQATLPVGK
jgi:acid phosphatase type 7